MAGTRHASAARTWVVVIVEALRPDTWDQKIGTKVLSVMTDST
jgi:hypothetical protein